MKGKGLPDQDQMAGRGTLYLAGQEGARCDVPLDCVHGSDSANQWTELR